MIERAATGILQELALGYPVVSITGPRQSGKTTLARKVFADKPYVSLEDPDQRELALNDPRGFLARYPDGAILDEVQRCPELFSYLQTRVDMDGRCGLFVLTGSQQFGLMNGITQSLAGRVGFVSLLPLSLPELQSAEKAPSTLEELLFTGGYPPLYSRRLSPSGWHAGYVRTYLERDLWQLLNVRDLSTFQRFVRMCAARTGMLLNLSALANDCGISHNTAKAWLSVLEACFLIILLQPHHRNFNKRLVKTPKLYFLDTGVACWLLGIQDPRQLEVHALRGQLFETWVVGELLKGRFNRGLVSNLYFWRDNIGNEIDVIAEQGELLLPVEVKSGQTVTRNYFSGLEKWLELAGAAAGRPWLVYGGQVGQHRSKVEVIPWHEIARLAETV